MKRRTFSRRRLAHMLIRPRPARAHDKIAAKPTGTTVDEMADHRTPAVATAAATKPQRTTRY